MKRIHYGDLDSRRKENYNFANVGAVLADYGFVCLNGNPEELKRQLKDFPHTQVWPLEIGNPVKR